MARFRLRFLLQELDLVGSDIVIGRSPDCQITIEDPLVSRQHARLRIRNDTVFIADVGSRNGVRVNGTLIRGETPLAHNDRVRLGTQDLVFLIVDENAERTSRSTGYMIHCRGCGRPFPGESLMCPHCGTSADEEGDTVTNLVYEPKASWTFQLLVEVVERVLLNGRVEEAERLLRKATAEVDEKLVAGAQLEASDLATISVFALRLAKLSGQAEWAEWVINVHRAQGVLPSETVLDALECLDRTSFATIKPMVEGFLRWWRSSHTGGVGDEETRRVQRFAKLAESVPQSSP